MSNTSFSTVGPEKQKRPTMFAAKDFPGLPSSFTVFGTGMGGRDGSGGMLLMPREQRDQRDSQHEPPRKRSESSTGPHPQAPRPDPEAAPPKEHHQSRYIYIYIYIYIWIYISFFKNKKKNSPKSSKPSSPAGCPVPSSPHSGPPLHPQGTNLAPKPTPKPEPQIPRSSAVSESSSAVS